MFVLFLTNLEHCVLLVWCIFVSVFGDGSGVLRLAHTHGSCAVADAVAFVASGNRSCVLSSSRPGTG